MPTPIVQSGVFDGGAGVHHFFPSITANSADDALIGFSRSDATKFVEAVTAGRFGTDAPGTMMLPSVLKAGEGCYVKTFGKMLNRWGDYSATSVDPTDDLTFWTVQEYAATPSPATSCADGSGRWGTWWGTTTAVSTVAASHNLDPFVSLLKSTTSTSTSTTTTTRPPTTTTSTTFTTSSTSTTTTSTTSTSTRSTTTTTSPTTTTTLPCTSARCTLEAVQTNPTCAGQTIPASVTKRFNRATSLIDQARTGPAKQTRKLHKRAKKALKQAAAKAVRAAKGKKPKISAACAEALKEAADSVVGGLGV